MFCLPGDDPEQPDNGFLIIAVEHTPAAPYAALANAGSKPSYLYPIRADTYTRYFTESEVARAYADRALGRAARLAQLDSVWNENRSDLAPHKVWFMAALTAGFA